MLVRRFAGLTVGCLLAATVGATAAAAAPAPSMSPQLPHSTSGPIGGPLLGSTGLVIQPHADAPALPTSLPASSWLVADIGTGQILAAKAPHVRHLPASTLKTLTAITLLPRLDPDLQVRATQADARVDG